jgi:hypothetical protein
MVCAAASPKTCQNSHLHTLTWKEGVFEQELGGGGGGGGWGLGGTGADNGSLLAHFPIAGRTSPLQ